MSIWERLRGWWITGRTHNAIAERECVHDGSEPMCRECAWAYNGA